MGRQPPEKRPLARWERAGRGDLLLAKAWRVVDEQVNDDVASAGLDEHRHSCGEATWTPQKGIGNSETIEAGGLRRMHIVHSTAICLSLAAHLNGAP